MLDMASYASRHVHLFTLLIGIKANMFLRGFISRQSLSLFKRILTIILISSKRVMAIAYASFVLTLKCCIVASKVQPLLHAVLAGDNEALAWRKRQATS